MTLGREADGGGTKGGAGGQREERGTTSVSRRLSFLHLARNEEWQHDGRKQNFLPLLSQLWFLKVPHGGGHGGDVWEESPIIETHLKATV